MEAKTRKGYLSIANNFLSKRKATLKTVEQVLPALLEAAGEYRPDYWRRLKLGLAMVMEGIGQPAAAEQIRAAKNPCPKEERKKKQKRAKRVYANDDEIILEALGKKGDEPLLAAVNLTRILGVRPAELSSIKEVKGGFFISGAKKTARGNRGADRIIKPKDEDGFLLVRTFIGLLGDPSPEDVGAIQSRIRRLSRKLFPKRKTHYSLVSWRHQMGSNLKASGFPPEEVAYIMGHQSTASVARYGDKRTKTGLPLARSAIPLCEMQDIVRIPRGSVPTPLPAP